MSNIAYYIKQKREEKGMSQGALANLVGVGRTAIANYEGGRSEPSLEKLQKLATGLDTTVDFLVTGAVRSHGDLVMESEGTYGVVGQVKDADSRKSLETFGNMTISGLVGLFARIGDLEARLKKLEEEKTKDNE